MRLCCHFCGGPFEWRLLVLRGAGVIEDCRVCDACARARGGRLGLEPVIRLCDSCLEFSATSLVDRAGRVIANYCEAHRPRRS